MTAKNIAVGVVHAIHDKSIVYLPWQRIEKRWRGSQCEAEIGEKAQFTRRK
jgi:hypothetical protein